MSEQDLFRESTGLYALGALAPAERRLFEDHLQSCDGCAAELRALRATVDALPFSVAQVDPHPSLRERILAAASEARHPSSVVPFERRPASQGSRMDAPVGRSRGAWAGWLAAAAAVLVATATSMYAVNLRTRLENAQVRLADTATRLQESDARLQAATRESTSVRTSLALLTAPDTVDLRLAGQAPAPAARARVFLSRSTSGLLFAATNLPAIPNDRIYQLWFLTPGAPVSAGLLRPDPNGTATVRFDVAPGAPAPTGLAVTIEPEGGLPAPTGAIYLVTQ